MTAYVVPVPYESIHRSVHLFVHPIIDRSIYIYLSGSLSLLYPSNCLSIYLSICRSVFLSVYLSAGLRGRLRPAGRLAHQTTNLFM